MDTHGIIDRVSDVGERARERRMEHRLEKLDRENDHLRTEVGSLRRDLEGERGSLRDVLKALQQREKVTVDVRRRGRVLTTLALAGGTYVLGTRAGRDRYDQMRGWLRSLGTKVQHEIEERKGTGGRWSIDPAEGTVSAGSRSSGATSTGTNGSV